MMFKKQDLQDWLNEYTEALEIAFEQAGDDLNRLTYLQGIKLTLENFQIDFQLKGGDE